MMKKINFIVVCSLFIMMMTGMICTSCGNSENAGKEPENSSVESSEMTDTHLPADVETTESEITQTEVAESKKETKGAESTASGKTVSESDNTPVSMSDALFIGDSRTVGIMEYAGLNEATFFCDTGMSVFNVQKKRISVPSIGKVTLEELLTNKKYGKIYIMLGINELGYEFNSIVDKYNEFIEFVKKTQPDAAVFLQANLHVSKKRSDSDKVINNTAIDKLNVELSKIADRKNIFYLDANVLFDDANGNLDAGKTQDQAHLLGKYYAEWGDWIRSESANYSTLNNN